MSGRVTLLNQVPVDWAAKRQAVTADSPAAAEILALSEAVKAGRLFMWRCRDSGMDVGGAEPQVTMHTDNRQAKSYAEATCVNTRMGGTFDRKEDWVKELRDAGCVQVEHIRSSENIADLFTKPFSSGNFNRLVKLIQSGG